MIFTGNDMKTTEELIKEYQIEIYGDFEPTEPMTVESLIESHRYLRSLNLQEQETFNKAVAEGMIYGREQGLKQVTELEYVKYEDLKKMTLVEIANKIADYWD